jgi:hypothetical protein
MKMFALKLLFLVSALAWVHAMWSSSASVKRGHFQIDLEDEMDAGPAAAHPVAVDPAAQPALPQPVAGNDEAPGVALLRSAVDPAVLPALQQLVAGDDEAPGAALLFAAFEPADQHALQVPPVCADDWPDADPRSASKFFLWTVVRTEVPGRLTPAEIGREGLYKALVATFGSVFPATHECHGGPSFGKVVQEMHDYSSKSDEREPHLHCVTVSPSEHRWKMIERIMRTEHHIKAGWGAATVFLLFV